MADHCTTGGPAFPIPGERWADGKVTYPGMTLLDYAAIHAPSMGEWCIEPEWAAGDACARYTWAAAMLAERQRRNKP